MRDRPERQPLWKPTGVITKSVNKVGRTDILVQILELVQAALQMQVRFE
jgi:hypothetical protein